MTFARNPHDYCPDCGYWDLLRSLWPGNNGLIEKWQCTFCGWIGDRQ